MPKQEITKFPPDDYVFCEPDKCGEPHFDGSKGGPRATDKLVCGGQCKGEDNCNCILCYSISTQYRGKKKKFVKLPTPALPTGFPPERNQVEEIEKEVKRKWGRKPGLVILAFGWECYCLKDAPITGKKKVREPEDVMG